MGPNNAVDEWTDKRLKWRCAIPLSQLLQFTINKNAVFLIQLFAVSTCVSSLYGGWLVPDLSSFGREKNLGPIIEHYVIALLYLLNLL